MWIFLPEEIREKCNSIQGMEESNEYRESSRRNISIQQWLDLLHMAKAAYKEQSWIDETFMFSEGKIICEGNLYIKYCKSLTKIPDNLYISGSLDLTHCTSLAKLPDNLHVNGFLYLLDCYSLTKLSDNLHIGGGIHLSDCNSLAELPDNFHVNRYLDLSNCTSLKKLPGDLYVKYTLVLSENLHPQVKKDAEILKQKGQIGDITCNS